MPCTRGYSFRTTLSRHDAEKFHMIVPHEGGVLHAALIRKLLDCRRVELDCRRGNGFPPVIPEREGNRDQEDHDPCDNYPPVIELHRLFFP